MKLIALLVLSAAGLLADATGTWTGTMTVAGREPGPALLILKQEGGKLTGSAGPRPEEQHEIANGKVEGERVTFELLRDGRAMKFVLKQEGEDLQGDIMLEQDGQTQTAHIVVKRSK